VEELHFEVGHAANLELRSQSLSGICWTLIPSLRLGDTEFELLMECVKVNRLLAGAIGAKIAFRVYRKSRVIALISEERRHAGRGTQSIVVSKLRKWKKSGPVVLLVVAVHPEMLFEHLVGAFGLAVALGVVTGSEMEFHVKGLAQGTEEMRNELRAPIRGDVTGYSVLREYVKYEEFRKFWSSDRVCCRNKDSLFREPVNDQEDGGISRGSRKLFNEVHGYRMPRELQNWKLTEEAVGLMTDRFIPLTRRTGLAVVNHKLSHLRPYELTLDQR
jgi:hypothetical protein